MSGKKFYLYEYLSEAERQEYVSWKKCVEKARDESVKRGIPCILPVFWLDLSISYLYEIQDELPYEIKRLLFQTIN